MAKTKITDYSATRASNSDIDGINIAEGCPAGNMNDFGREIMVHLAETNAGTYPVADTWSFADPADLTKIVRLDAGGVTAGQTRVLTAPDYNGTISTLDGTETLTNKTLTTPTITLKQATGPTPTAEGDMQWDTDDNAIVVGDGSGQKIFRANAWEIISTQTASSSASLVWTGLSAYRALRISGTIRPSTDAVAAFARISVDAGTSYVSTSSYNYQIGRIAGGSSAPIGGTTTGILIAGTTTIGNAANEYSSFTINIEQFNKSTHMMFSGTAIATTELGTLVSSVIGGSYGSATARDAIQVIMDSGNIADGYVTLEGIRG